MSTAVQPAQGDTHALMPNQVIANKITDIVNTNLDLRGLFTVDTTLTTSAGLSKRIYKYTYSGTVEQLAKGAKNTQKGAVSLVYDEYDVKRYQQTYEYNDMDVMADPNIVNVLADGAGKTMSNEIKSEYFTELGKITNHFDAKSYTSLYEAAVDAVAALPKAAEKDITDLFLIMGADARAKVRKDSLFEAARQGEILFTGHFGNISGIPCVYSNLVPANTIYLTEKEAITFFVKREGTVEQARDIESKDNTVVYERHGLIAITDDTRSAIIDVNSTYAAVDSTGQGYSNKNPKTEGWYEKGSTGLYFLSAETSVGTKTYYTKA